MNEVIGILQTFASFAAFVICLHNFKKRPCRMQRISHHVHGHALVLYFCVSESFQTWRGTINLLNITRADKWKVDLWLWQLQREYWIVYIKQFTGDESCWHAHWPQNDQQRRRFAAPARNTRLSETIKLCLVLAASSNDTVSGRSQPKCHWVTSVMTFPTGVVTGSAISPSQHRITLVWNDRWQQILF